MKTAYEYAVQELNNAECNYNNSYEYQDYFYFKIQAAKSLIDDIRKKEAERLYIERLLALQYKPVKVTLLQRIRGFLNGRVNT